MDSVERDQREKEHRSERGEILFRRGRTAGKENSFSNNLPAGKSGAAFRKTGNDPAVSGFAPEEQVINVKIKDKK